MNWLVDATLVVMISGSICGLASFGWITVLTVQGYVRQRQHRTDAAASVQGIADEVSRRLEACPTEKFHD